MADKKVRLTEDQAFQILLKGMETGQIKLPFLNTVSVEKMTEVIQRMRLQEQQGDSVDSYSIARGLARSAKLDAVYLLTLYAFLTEGLTDKQTTELARLYEGSEF